MANAVEAEEQWSCKRSPDLDSFTCMGAKNPCPGMWPVRTPRAQNAGFIKRITEHCYRRNIKAIGRMVSEKRYFVCFPIVSIWELMAPGWSHFEHHMTLLHTKYTCISFVSCGFREEDSFICYLL